MERQVHAEAAGRAAAGGAVADRREGREGHVRHRHRTHSFDETNAPVDGVDRRPALTRRPALPSLTSRPGLPWPGRSALRRTNSIRGSAGTATAARCCGSGTCTQTCGSRKNTDAARRLDVALHERAIEVQLAAGRPRPPGARSGRAGCVRAPRPAGSNASASRRPAGQVAAERQAGAPVLRIRGDQPPAALLELLRRALLVVEPLEPVEGEIGALGRARRSAGPRRHRRRRGRPAIRRTSPRLRYAGAVRGIEVDRRLEVARGRGRGRRPPGPRRRARSRGRRESPGCAAACRARSAPTSCWRMR